MKRSMPTDPCPSGFSVPSAPGTSFGGQSPSLQCTETTWAASTPSASIGSPVPYRIMLAGSKLMRSEEHTSELQSQSNLVCRLLLEKKKKTSVDISNMSSSYLRLELLLAVC